MLKTHELCETFAPFTIKGMGLRNLMGDFPHKSSRGNLYVISMYEYDSSTILSEPIKNRQSATIRDAFLKAHKVLKAIDSDPKVYIMDNRCSSDLKEAMKKYEIDLQLAPNHMQIQNTAERAIRTWKNHFIAGFSTTYPDLPIREWDRQLYQCVITLNLLQNYRINPALSAYAYLFGPYDFNKSPMAPPGTRVILYEKLATVHNGDIMAHRGGILVHKFTTADVCSVTCPQLA